VRERLLIELAEVTDSSLPQGWRLSARVLRHCPTHGRHALGLLLLQLPVGLPHTPDALVRDAIRWCDTGFPLPLTSVKSTLCATRAELLKRQGRYGAAVDMFFLSGDLNTLRALCKRCFETASKAVENFLEVLPSDSSNLENAISQVASEQRTMCAVCAALTRNGDVSGDLQGDVLFLSAYRDLVVLVATLDSTSHLSLETATAIDQALALAPLGAKTHFLNISFRLLDSFSSDRTVLFHQSLLERLMSTIEDVCGCTRPALQLSKDRALNLQHLLTTSLAASFISANQRSSERPDHAIHDANKASTVSIRSRSHQQVERQTDSDFFGASAADLLDLPPLIC